LVESILFEPTVSAINVPGDPVQGSGNFVREFEGLSTAVAMDAAQRAWVPGTPSSEFVATGHIAAPLSFRPPDRGKNCFLHLTKKGIVCDA
jgi:hypothetical protein